MGFECYDGYVCCSGISERQCDGVTKATVGAGTVGAVVGGTIDYCCVHSCPTSCTLGACGVGAMVGYVATVGIVGVVIVGNDIGHYVLKKQAQCSSNRMTSEQTPLQAETENDSDTLTCCCCLQAN